MSTDTLNCDGAHTLNGDGTQTMNGDGVHTANGDGTEFVKSVGVFEFNEGSTFDDYLRHPSRSRSRPGPADAQLRQFIRGVNRDYLVSSQARKAVHAAVLAQAARNVTTHHQRLKDFDKGIGKSRIRRRILTPSARFIRNQLVSSAACEAMGHDIASDRMNALWERMTSAPNDTVVLDAASELDMPKYAPPATYSTIEEWWTMQQARTASDLSSDSDATPVGYVDLAECGVLYDATQRAQADPDSPDDSDATVEQE